MTQYDFKKEWPKIRKQLNNLSQDALQLAKKGEEQVVKFSRQGKWQLDSTALGVRKEQLYYLIGKAYVNADAPNAPTAEIRKYLAEVKKLDRQIHSLKRKIADEAKKAPAAKKKSAKKATKRTTKKKTATTGDIADISRPEDSAQE